GRRLLIATSKMGTHAAWLQHDENLMKLGRTTDADLSPARSAQTAPRRGGGAGRPRVISDRPLPTQPERLPNGFPKLLTGSHIHRKFPSRRHIVGSRNPFLFTDG